MKIGCLEFDTKRQLAGDKCRCLFCCILYKYDTNCETEYRTFASPFNDVPWERSPPMVSNSTFGGV